MFLLIPFATALLLIGNVGAGPTVPSVGEMPLVESIEDDPGPESKFEEQIVEFHNRGIRLSGSLLLPRTRSTVPAVLFVHGAGRQSRESYREIGEFFANHGIAALIYDKRGTGLSGGEYESFEPYENLVQDSLSAITFLKACRGIDPSRLGIWGLSQGAYISAAVATRSHDIRFLMVVGADVAAGMMFYYRDNLFRHYGLSEKLRDVAEKMCIVDQDLQQTFRESFRISSLLPRHYSPPDQFVHPVWSRVKQPVLAMWGQLDQHVPVGESVAGMKNSLNQANNAEWTIIIVPRTNHDLKLSETGDLQSKSQGYPVEALQTMVDWTTGVLDRPREISKMKQEGFAPVVDILPRLEAYENLRWFGNGAIQAALWILFVISFGCNMIVTLRRYLPFIVRRQEKVKAREASRLVNLKRAICTLNFLILAAFSITAVLVVDQICPKCPTVLSFTPLVGLASTLATITFLTRLFWTPRTEGWTVLRGTRFTVEVLGMVLFVPFLFYWNMIGIRL